MKYTQRSTKSLSERLWAKVNRNGPVVSNELGNCWVWTGAAGGNKRYGTIQRGRRGNGLVRVHRAAYELEIGTIPDGLDVCHKCDNRKCVRPSHLFVGTRQDNMDDCVSKGRTRSSETIRSLKRDSQGRVLPRHA